MSYMKHKEGSLEQAVMRSVFGDNLNEKFNAATTNPDHILGEKLSAGQKKLDVDGDGEIEGSDLAKLRKKAAKKEGNAFGKALMSAKEKGEKTFVVAGKKYDVTEEESKLTETNEIGTPELTRKSIEVTPGQSSPAWEEQVSAIHKKTLTMREALKQVWQGQEAKNPFDDKPVKKEQQKTMTGKSVTKVEVDPKIKD